MYVTTYVIFNHYTVLVEMFIITDPQYTSWVKRTINHPFITYRNILRDSKYPKIDDFGSKIEFESWVILPKIIKNIKKTLFS